MPILTEEELRELEADPKTVALAKKLREGSFIPKERFDEVNEKKKQLEEAATRRAEAESRAEKERLVRQSEWEKLASKLEEEKAELARRFDAEKAVADQHRSHLAGAKEKAKAALGSRWLSIYEQASLDDLDKILQANALPPMAVHTGDPGIPKKKSVREMSAAEFRAYAEAVQRGEST
jgi:hypothetical protein